MRKRKRKNITLIEIMIVMLLIGLIGGALAFNMRGSMDEGRAFKTRQNQHRIEEILMLEESKGESTGGDIADNWEAIVKNSPLVKGDAILKDGWKNKFAISYSEGEFLVKSKGLENYESKGQEKG